MTLRPDDVRLIAATQLKIGHAEPSVGEKFGRAHDAGSVVKGVHAPAMVRHDEPVVAELELVAAVDAAFVLAGTGLTPWPDPHPNRAPLDVEYSRLTNPARWRITGNRADAWLAALTAVGVASVQRNAPIRWRQQPGPQISRADRVLPFAAGALPMVLARSRLGEVDDAGVVIGVGDPTTCLAWFPDCGCDACDSGSEDELDNLDRHILGIITGTLRQFRDGPRNITVLDDHGWSASGHFERNEIDAILQEPSGWEKLAGASWLNPR